MKILAIMGSPRDGQTKKAVEIFEKLLKEYIEVDFTYLYLKNMKLEICKGCALCLSKGEEYCPLKDDKDIILKKMDEADGVIFATPNYSLQVSGLMKNLFDRLAFIFHRPRFFHKISTSIVTQGIYGGGDISKYLSTLSKFWGFVSIPGVTLTTPWGAYNPNTEWTKEGEEKIHIKLDKLAKKFHKGLIGNKSPKPKLNQLIIFRLVRSAQKYSINHDRDHVYFRDNGWFQSDYYYNVRLGFVQKTIGKLIDKIQQKNLGKSIIKEENSEA
ncbi:NADPH-dependent FMN reductase RutF [Gottschalkia purinilytica]|uniref:NADPH-dependent FMN reductase RutF n=1 Tax=Gottschalkia purinilytica TaxID=1503 RepID=A0A0L0WF22_GOTPU|nr:flavodoxin family protein [Gottschalkia purinilytica]KNF10083.1 NADPH-dependent FMN reductase RutF [Gottschalkia purinilytica]